MGVRRSSATLVGRDVELRAVEEAIEARLECPVILLGGEAGVGKSRLIREVATRATARAATVTVGSCVQLGADLLPYAPFVEALGRLVETLGDEADALVGPAGGDLAVLRPGLGSHLDGDAGRAAGTPAAASRGRMNEALREVLDRAPDPLVMVLEDIHWADRSSLELLSYLARRLRHGRTALLASFRTDELTRRHPLVPVLAELERGRRCVRIDLGRLDDAAVAELVREIRGEAPAALVDAIATRSDGNPFLVEELLAVDADSRSRLPDTLRELLLARLATLGAPARRALAIAAVVGRPVEPELVEAAWGDSAAALDEALREAVDRSLLVVEPVRGRFAFSHALIAEAVEDDLMPGERVWFHATLARVLAARPDLASPTHAGAAAELAHHLLAARDLPAALDASVRAADAAAAARAYPEAHLLYERALELLERFPDGLDRLGIDRIALLDAAAEASFHAGDAGRAAALGRLAVSENERGPDQAMTGYLLVRNLEWTEGSEHGALHELAERAVNLVPADPPTPRRAFVLVGQASARMHTGRNHDAAVIAAEAASVAAACSATGYEAIARSVMAITLAALGRDDEAIAEADRSVALADASRGTEEAAIVYANAVGVRSWLGRHAEVAEILSAARRALDGEGALASNEAFLAVNEAGVLAWQGRWDDADGLCSRYIGDRTGRDDLAGLLCIRGALRARRGLFDAGDDDLRAALALRPLIFLETVAEAFGRLAETALDRARPAEALMLVDEGLAALAPGDDLQWRGHLSAVGLRAAADLGERARARRERRASADAGAAAGRHLETLRAALEGRLVEGGGVDDVLRSRAAWGFAEASRGTGTPDPDLWAAAAAALASVGEPHQAAYCRFREAEAALSGPGDRPRASAALRDARSWAVKVGAEPLRADIDGLARRARLELVADDVLAGDAEFAGAPPPPSARSPAADNPYALSPREREVLACLVDGRTNREIGAVLFISEKTASVHVSHILDKLGVTSRGAAAALAARGGLVEIEGPGD